MQKFLEETYSVLSQSESFYRKFRVHIIQCDERVQSDVVVTNAKELQEYMDHLRSVVWVERTSVRYLVMSTVFWQKKKFTKLKGLLYFTDGYGRYPLKKPPYDTAFVFLKRGLSGCGCPTVGDQTDLRRRGFRRTTVGGK